MSKPRVLVVEDEPGIAEVIRYTLQSEGFAPEMAASGAQALALFAAAPPDLAILDIGLPDMSGFELFRQLQRLPGADSAPMIFLTARAEEIDRVAGLELGADDYIAKPFSPRELAARARAILRRSQRVRQPPDSPPENGPAAWTAAQTRTGPFTHSPEQRLIGYHGQPLALSRYEYGLLAALLRRPGRIHTRAELLEQVWGSDCDSFDRTVDTHIKTLRAKLRAIHPADDPIHTERGLGYALRPQP